MMRALLYTALLCANACRAEPVHEGYGLNFNNTSHLTLHANGEPALTMQLHPSKFVSGPPEGVLFSKHPTPKLPPAGMRDYLVDPNAAWNCYDGDTCTFDVNLPSIGVYQVDQPEWDYGLGVRLMHPTPSDTMWAMPLMKRVEQHVRLCDINAPELHPGPNKKAIKARDALVAAIKGAKQIVIRVPQDEHGDQYEKYGRLLGYIMADGVNLNQMQLQQGNAKPFIKCNPSQ